MTGTTRHRVAICMRQPTRMHIMQARPPQPADVTRPAAIKPNRPLFQQAVAESTRQSRQRKRFGAEVGVELPGEKKKKHKHSKRSKS